MWVGDYSNMNRPLPIPNREVKHIYADGTAFMWKSRTSPMILTGQILTSRLTVRPTDVTIGFFQFALMKKIKFFHQC